MSGRRKEWCDFSEQTTEPERRKRFIYLVHEVQSKPQKHQGEESNHNHCRNMEELSHLITAQQELISVLFSYYFLTPSYFVFRCVSCVSIMSLHNYSHVIPRVLTTSSLPPSTHQQLVLSETIRHESCSSPTLFAFLVFLFLSSSLCPLLPGDTVIKASDDSGQTGWLLQLPWQPE